MVGTGASARIDRARRWNLSDRTGLAGRESLHRGLYRLDLVQLRLHLSHRRRHPAGTRFGRGTEPLAARRPRRFAALKGKLDLRYPGDYRPKRTVRSGGGKQKEYNHYVPFDLKFALADGNLLALQVDLKARTNRMPAAVRMRRGSAQKNHSPRRDRRHGFPTPPVPTHRDRGRAGNQCLRSIRAANRLPLERR